MTDRRAKLGARARLEAMTPRSREARERGAALLALEAAPTFAMPVPLYIASAEGARMTDLDGNSYIDLAMGFGVHLLGHRPPVIEEALARQVSTLWHPAITHTVQHDLAELLCELVPGADRVVFCNSGTEATMYAMRVARAFTGRDRIALFEGHYHGAHDQALVKDDPRSPRPRPRAKTIGLGIPESVRESTLILPYRHDNACALIREHRDDLAAVVAQPVQNTVPRDDGKAFLEDLRAVCDETGVLLVFDEIVTGFRLAPGGGQERFGIRADLAAHGKILGGGLPLGALSGRGDIMALFTGGQRSGAGVFSGGTFSGNPLSCAAGTAQLRHLSEHRSRLYPDLEGKSARLVDRINGYCRHHGMAAQVMRAGSLFALHFSDRDILSTRDAYPVNREAEAVFYLELLLRGVLVPGWHLFFLSTAHSFDDVDQVIAAFEDSFAAVRYAGLL